MKPTEAAVSIFLAVIGVATIALLVSRQADTANVFSSVGSSFSSVLCRALSPVTGSSCGDRDNGLTPRVTTAITYPGFPK